ncbi:MAG: hypothetical protein DA408_19565 [Bacteroidetes bacterium]|nr:MAG: hypothetical protein DA408_19565 [Bacteroidota bacterium]
MKTDQTPPSRNQVYLVASTFRANKHHGTPPHEDCYALVLDFPQDDILERVSLRDKKIKLNGPQLPTSEELKASEVTQEYILPFFAVNDPAYSSQLAQFSGSPTYKIRRITSYVAIDSYEPTNTETKEYSVSTGKSKEENYNNEIGVTLGVSVTAGGKAGVPLVAEGEVSLTVSVEASYSRSWGGATSTYEERSFNYPQTVTGKCFGALFQAKSSYTIFRKDGSMVGAPIEVKLNEFYTEEWCPENVLEEKNQNNTAGEGKSGTSSPNTITFTIDAPPGKTVILEGRLEIYDGRLVSAPAGVIMGIPKSVFNKSQEFTVSSPSDIVKAGNIISDSYTKSAWIKLDALPDSRPNNIISGNKAQHAFWVPGTLGNHLAAGHNGKWDYVSAPKSITGGWHHTAVSYDASQRQMKLYLDGELIDSEDNVPPYFKDSENATLIGGYNGAHNFNGSLKNVQIWNNVLSDEQVKSLYATDQE